MNISKVLLSIIFSLLLCSCAVMPEFTEKFDKKCQKVQKKVELTIEQTAMFDDLECSNKGDCKAMFLGNIIGSVIVFPVSAIISASIAVVGNTIYWVEEYGQCSS